MNLDFCLKKGELNTYIFCSLSIYIKLEYRALKTSFLERSFPTLYRYLSNNAMTEGSKLSGNFSSAFGCP